MKKNTIRSKNKSTFRAPVTKISRPLMASKLEFDFIRPELFHYYAMYHVS